MSRAAIFAGASACYGSQPAPQQPAPPVPGDVAREAPATESAPAASATIRGVVIDTRTNRPRPNVEVYLETSERPIAATTRSDADGAYAFAGLQPGEYLVSTRTSPPRRRQDPERSEVPPPTLKVKAGETRVQNVFYFENVPSSVKMPYGAPPARTRVV